MQLKIALLTTQSTLVEQVRALLSGWDGAPVLLPQAVEAEGAALVAEQEQPHVMLVDGSRHAPADLLALESVTARHPALAVMLLSPCHTAEFLRQAMRIGLRDVLPLPLAREPLLEALGRVRKRAASGAPGRRGKVLAFMGCKGGSGATFIAANLAAMLATQERRKVALIDLNCQFGDAALHVTHRVPSCTLADAAEQVHRLDEALLASYMIQVSPGFSLLPAPAGPEQALRVRAEAIEPLLRVAAAAHDVVIVDAGRSLDDVTVRALDKSDALYAVLQLNFPSLSDASRLLHALTSLGYGKEKLQVLVNRFRKGGAITVEDVTQTLRHPVCRTIPNSYAAVADSVDQGVPLCTLAPRDPVARALADFAASLVEGKKLPPAGWLRGVLS